MKRTHLYLVECTTLKNKRFSFKRTLDGYSLRLLQLRLKDRLDIKEVKITELLPKASIYKLLNKEGLTCSTLELISTLYPHSYEEVSAIILSKYDVNDPIVKEFLSSYAYNCH